MMPREGSAHALPSPAPAVVVDALAAAGLRRQTLQAVLRAELGRYSSDPLIRLAGAGAVVAGTAVGLLTSASPVLLGITASALLWGLALLVTVHRERRGLLPFSLALVPRHRRLGWARTGAQALLAVVVLFTTGLAATLQRSGLAPGATSATLVDLLAGVLVGTALGIVAGWQAVSARRVLLALALWLPWATLVAVLVLSGQPVPAGALLLLAAAITGVAADQTLRRGS